MCSVISAAEITAATGKTVADASPDTRTGQDPPSPTSCFWADSDTGEIAAANVEQDYGLKGNDLLIDSQALDSQGLCERGRFAYSEGDTIIRCVVDGFDFELNIEAPLDKALSIVSLMHARLKT